MQTASASVSIDVGGTPGVGILNGRVWHDANFDTIADAAERKLEGWTVGHVLTHLARNADSHVRMLEAAARSSHEHSVIAGPWGDR